MSTTRTTKSVRNPEEIRVRKLLLKYNIKQNEVADELGITFQSVYGRMKRGSVKPIIEAIDRIKESRMKQAV